MKYAVIELFIVFTMVGNAMSAGSVEKKVEMGKNDFALIADYADAFLSANNGTG